MAKKKKSTKKQTKERKENKVMKINVDSGGPGFFSDFVTIFHNPRNFIIDFQQTTPRYTRIGNEKTEQTMYVRHNTIILNPQVTKELLKVLGENIEKYENKFEKIDVKKTKSGRTKNSKKTDHTKSYIG